MTKTHTAPTAPTAIATPAARRAQVLADLLSLPVVESAADVRKVGGAFRKVAKDHLQDRTSGEQSLREAWSAIEARFAVDPDDARETALSDQEAATRTELERITADLKRVEGEQKSLRALKSAVLDERKRTGIAMRDAGWSQKATARVLGVTDRTVRMWTAPAPEEAPEETGADEVADAAPVTAPTAAEVSALLLRAAEMAAALEEVTPSQARALRTALAKVGAALDSVAAPVAA